MRNKPQSPRPPIAALAVATFVMFATFGAGCAAMQRVPGQTVQKAHVDVKAVTMEAFSKRSVGGQLELSVQNPSKVVVQLRYIEWEMSVGGDRVVGRTDVNGQIPAQTSAPLSAALEVLAADAERVVPHLDEGMRDYELHGVLHYGTPSGDASVGFQSTGTL